MTDIDDQLLHSEQPPALLQATVTTTLKDQQYDPKQPGSSYFLYNRITSSSYQIHKSKQASVSHYKNMTPKMDTLRLLSSSYFQIYTGQVELLKIKP